MRFTARRMSIVREALADEVLETQQPDVVKRLIAQVALRLTIEGRDTAHGDCSSRVLTPPACTLCAASAWRCRASPQVLCGPGQHLDATKVLEWCMWP